MEIEKIGKTVNIAIDEGLSELNTTIDKIDYKILQYPSKGFLGLFKKPAKVLISLKEEENYVDTKDDTRTSINNTTPIVKKEPSNVYNDEVADIKNAPLEKTQKEHIKDIKKEVKNNIKKETQKDVQNDTQDKQKEESINISDDETKDIFIDAPIVATSFLKQIFDNMDINITIDSRINERNNLDIELAGDDIGVIIGKRGQTLDSLQYLVNLVINKGEYAYMAIYIDTQDYRERRRKALETLAINLSKKAKKIRKNVVLEPMNPYERRIIHSKLQNSPDVRTYSEGEEPFRYVVITPKNM